MTKVISLRERKKVALRSQIVTTAIELFSRHGFAAVTVDQVAEAADVGKGTIYNYFHTKEHIVVAFMADLEVRVQSRLDRIVDEGRPVESILAEFIDLQFRFKSAYHQLSGFF